MQHGELVRMPRQHVGEAGLSIRCHGDYHLAQLLNTGKEFVVIDFEGEAARPLGERRLKRSPLAAAEGKPKLQAVLRKFGATA